MPDSSAVDAALVGVLINDGTLMGLMGDGVYFDQAGERATQFVLVSLVEAHDEPMQGGRAYEDATYLVKAVARATSGADVKTAAARIDTLLEGQSLAPVGYSLMAMRRTSRVRYTEVDEVDPSIRWQHRGGHYQIVVSG